MRIAILVNGNGSRNGPVDGDSIRGGGVGVSGTDTSAVMLAEGLVSLGHAVTVACDLKNPIKVVRGVRYTDLCFSDYIERPTFEVLINTLWFDDYENLDIVVTRAVVQWCHMQYVYGVDPVSAYAKANDLRQGVVHLSDWSREKVQCYVARLRELAGEEKEIAQAVIPNMMPVELYVDVEQPVPRSVVFHAAWGRGGTVALDVVARLDAPVHPEPAHSIGVSCCWKLHVASYIHHAPQSRLVENHGVLDKERLYALLARSEYFLYPCVDPLSLDVHMDTFSCVVAEALAMGCTVVAYRVGCLEELFGACVEFVDFPEGADVEAMRRLPLVKSAVMAEAREGLLAKMTELDAQPLATKQARRRRNVAFARGGRFEPSGALRAWSQFLLGVSPPNPPTGGGAPPGPSA